MLLHGIRYLEVIIDNELREITIFWIDMNVSYESERDFFFFSSRRRHTRSLCDWSSDVCSSDLEGHAVLREALDVETVARVRLLRLLSLGGPHERVDDVLAPLVDEHGDWLLADVVQIGRASCRERV